MRGSPLLRFIILSLALIAAGLGLRNVTAARLANPLPIASGGMEKPQAAARSVSFRLLLSAPASQVEIHSASVVTLPLDKSPLTGDLMLDSRNPQVALIVRWKIPTAAGEHRFAKLTLEPPGQETLTHVFDADGDIDDFLELPFPAAHE